MNGIHEHLVVGAVLGQVSEKMLQTPCSASEREEAEHAISRAAAVHPPNF